VRGGGWPGYRAADGPAADAPLSPGPGARAAD
jgi:hypothetical protein